MWTVRSIYDLLRGNRSEDLKTESFDGENVFFQMAISKLSMHLKFQISRNEKKERGVWMMILVAMDWYRGIYPFVDLSYEEESYLPGTNKKNGRKKQ